MERKISRRSVLRTGAASLTIGLAGCTGNDPQPDCTDTNAVLHFPHRMFVVTVPGESTNKARRVALKINDEGYYAKVRPTVDVDIEDRTVREGNGVFLIIVGDYTREDVVSRMDKNEINYTKIREIDGSLQKLLEDFPKVWKKDVLHSRVAYLNRIQSEAGISLPEIKTNNQYVIINDSPSDQEVNGIKNALEPRGMVEMRLSGTERSVSVFNQNGLGYVPLEKNPIEFNQWKVRPDSITIVKGESGNTLVFQMDDGGDEYAKMVSRAEGNDAKIEVWIDGQKLYSRPLTAREKNPPTNEYPGGVEVVDDFGPIQMPGLSRLKAVQLATVLKFPAKTPWPSKRIC